MKKILSMFLVFTVLLPVLSSAVLAFEYTLAPNDSLEIKLIGQKDMDTKQTIAPDGTISMPFLGRSTASGKTLKEFDVYLKAELGKYIEKPQVIVYLTPRSIYIIQHDLKKNTWEVKEAKTTEEARAYAGKDFKGDIKYGDVIAVDVSKEPDWWENNWYKVLTGTAVVVGIYETLKK